MKTSLILREVVAAAKLGQKTVARNLLREIHEREPKNEQALMWSAALAESSEEAMRHLENVLEINPHNEKAALALRQARLQGGISEIRKGSREIGPPLFFKILGQLGVSLEQFQRLR